MVAHLHFQGSDGEEVVWLVDAKNGRGDVKFNVKNDVKSDVTLTIGDDDLVDLMTGKLNSQKAFMQGNIVTRGALPSLARIGGRASFDSGLSQPIP